jgi:polyphosphate kinase
MMEKMKPDEKSLADGQTAAAPRTAKKEAGKVRIFDITSTEYYLNRELTWLGFNDRVLHEAQDKRNPLLERVKFAAITDSNLDEFFMKRIGGLKQQLAAGVLDVTPDGRTPREQIDQCLAFIKKHHARLQETVVELIALLKKKGIEILPYDSLDQAEKEALQEEYYDNIYPLITPQSIDPAHPFPFVSNLSMNLLVTLRYPGDREINFARVKVPVGAGAPRFFQIGEGQRFVLLEEIMANNLDMLFPGMEILTCELFRVTRNANTEKMEEHAEDLLALIESELQDRRFAPIVRMEILPGMKPLHRGWLAAELGLDEKEDVITVKTMLGIKDLWEIADLDRPALKHPPHHPCDHPDLLDNRKLFHILREKKAVLLQHPYESFSTSVERFLKEASDDPKVRAIKMTLYRTEPDSSIISSLIAAAQNGKQVTVVVELKARFDEAANIRVANRMEETGIHVTYGVMGLKTHSKVLLVVRQDYKGLRRYVHFGTGNYHPVTARIYSDLGMFVYDKDLGRDATELFNYLTTGFTPKRPYRKILVAPKALKKELLDKIRREMDLHSEENPGHIRFKMNALGDVDITRALYEASMAGVRVDLIIRDSCQLRPGIKGLSENIQVISIVGRFLEHSRIYYFRNGGAEEIYFGSADCLKRNLEYRVEVVVPVTDKSLIQALKGMLDYQWKDNRNAWEMRPDGSYVQRVPEEGKKAKPSQKTLASRAEKRFRAANRLRRRKPETPTKLPALDL